jgi:NAD(P) transhydrogenase subunit alpha
MKIAILKERRAHEARVAASAETIKKFVNLGVNVTIEKGAGQGSSIPDAEFKAAGASIAASASAALNGADLVLKVQRPMINGEKQDELSAFKSGQALVCQMSALSDTDFVAAMANAGVTGFAMELMPRISRAQSMDVLSSQSNLSGYKAVLDAASEFGRAFPMMMTAAGTVPPARVLIMGVGVAGLQAIATARRLGAVVSATDVRPATKEQVESLGATFIAVQDEEFEQAQTMGGYAKEMSSAYKEKQVALIAGTLAKQDVVICTALIPGRPAPELISAEMVASMKPGSVIVDLAVESGGNCALSQFDKVVKLNGVKIVGHANMPSRIATDASRLYAKNLLNFLTPLIDKESGSLNINMEDETVAGTLVTRDGEIVHPLLTDRLQPAAAKALTAEEAPDEAEVEEVVASAE